MGFTIMESFMDDVKVESALGLGTKITMRKRISGSQELRLRQEQICEG